MATPTPEEQAGDAFVASAAEAVETAVMAVRLMMAIADAVRRQQLKKEGKAEELPPVAESVGEASGDVRTLMPPDIGAALLTAADWPQIARQMVALHRAGVDMGALLPRVGEIAVTVRDSVGGKAGRAGHDTAVQKPEPGAEKAGRAVRDGADEWVRMLRETTPAGPVREAILSSPQWPEMAAEMARLAARGVDVRAVVVAAHDEGLGVGQAVSKRLWLPESLATSQDALRSYGPLTTGLDVVRDLDLGDREGALRKLAIAPSDNARFARMVREALPGREWAADLLVAERKWPLIAARMAALEFRGMPVADHLAALSEHTMWEAGPRPGLGGRLVLSAHDALCRPPGEAPGTPRVNTAAARAGSPSVGPTRPSAAKGAAPAGPAVAAHREAGPVAKGGRAR